MVWLRGMIGVWGEPTREPLSKEDGLVLSLILAFGLFALAIGLGHPFIPLWDEAMHQAAARGTLDTPGYPHIYVEHLVPFDLPSYWISQVWLNKPPAPFWFAAALMKVMGVTPLALRLVSLGSMLLTAVIVYLLARPLMGRIFAGLAAVIALSLPFGWLLVQGLYFGDVTDCSLVGCNTLAIGLLVLSIERQSWKLTAASGVVVGIGVLCKVMLAATPLGVAMVLGLMGRVRLTKGPKLRWVLGMFAIAAAVCVPWNVYAAHTWPDVYWMHARTWLGHLVPVKGLTAPIGAWLRPIDGIFNEINGGELSPIPAALTLFAGLWLLVRALVKREVIPLALAVWLWSSWLVLSVSENKVPAAAWGVMPAAIFAVVLLFHEGLRRPSLGFAAVATLFTPLLISHWPALAAVRAKFPASLQQTRDMPGLVEGMMLAFAGLLVGAVVGKLVGSRRFAPFALGLSPVLALIVLLTQVGIAQEKLAAQNESRLWSSQTREVGLAVDEATPKKSVLYLDTERESAETSDALTAIFWSGRMTYRGSPDASIATARAKGYHPYLLSPAAEKLVPVPGVPANAALRAYDVDQPTTEPAPMPEGVTPIIALLPTMSVLGVATGPAGPRKDRWAFFLNSGGPPVELHVIFHTAHGPEDVRVPASACLRDGARLAGAAWFVLPTLGPLRADVTALEFDAGGKIALGR